jgi:predicted ATPase
VACKSAETREQEATPDLNCTDHGESLFTVAENRFGGTEQFVGSDE